MYKNSPMLLFDFIDTDLSEFGDKLIQMILKYLYDGMYEKVKKLYEGMFDSLNQQISNASGMISNGPKAWNEGAFNTVQNIAENVCIPIAGCLITVIFCWELIHLVQESNHSMNEVKPDKIMLVLMKFALCMFVCAKSFDIVMGFYDFGAYAASKLSGNTVGTFGVALDAFLPENPTRYTVSMLFDLAGYWLVIGIGGIGVKICGVLVYIRVVLWFLEFLIYASAAPIPYSTWGNKEWSQVGMNYTRKMLAVSFEGFFMLLLFSIYGGVVSGASLTDFTQSMVMIIGCGFALVLMMFKAGNISASIFNAH